MIGDVRQGLWWENILTPTSPLVRNIDPNASRGMKDRPQRLTRVDVSYHGSHVICTISSLSSCQSYFGRLPISISDFQPVISLFHGGLLDIVIVRTKRTQHSPYALIHNKRREDIEFNKRCCDNYTKKRAKISTNERFERGLEKWSNLSEPSLETYSFAATSSERDWKLPSNSEIYSVFQSYLWFGYKYTHNSSSVMIFLENVQLFPSLHSFSNK